MLLDIGLNTARAVLTTSRTELLKKTDLEIETIDRVPVSYTHLDVYKRQVHNWGTTPTVYYFKRGQ